MHRDTGVACLAMRNMQEPQKGKAIVPIPAGPLRRTYRFNNELKKKKKRSTKSTTWNLVGTIVDASYRGRYQQNHRETLFL